MSDEEYRAIIGRYLPAASVAMVFDFIKANGVHFRITRQRTSKFGDYRMPQPRHQYHEISVNGDLTPHIFLLVLLHEMAHLMVYKQYGRRVQPHGHEWQEAYRALMVQYVGAGCFPEGSLPYFARYTSRIPLNRAAGQRLESYLKDYDLPEGAPREMTLSELPIGSQFRLKSNPGYLFKSLEKRRTRYRCMELQTRRMYLISGNAAVKNSGD